MTDAVVTWLDGADPDHISKLRKFLPDGYFTEHFFAAQYNNCNEIELCVTSIFKFYKDVGRVYIVTDGQDPRIKFPSLARFGDRIRIIDHRDIFREYGDFLPVFSPRPIESFIWRIKDLSDRFLYLNDDFIILNELEDSFFFEENKIRVYFHSSRNWSRRDPKKFARFWNIHRGYSILSSRKQDVAFYLPAHFPSMNITDEWSNLFDMFRDDFLKNARSRFRSDEDFIPGALFANYMLCEGKAVADFTQIGLFVGMECNDQEHLPLLESAIESGTKFVCINHLAGMKNADRFMQALTTRVMSADAAAPPS